MNRKLKHLMRRLKSLNDRASKDNIRERIALTYEVSKVKAAMARKDRPPNFGNEQDVLSESCGGNFPRRKVTVGDNPVNCEIVQNDRDRMQGMMHRQEMAIGDGMLFVFPGPMQQSFWMKDTHVPLDVAFVDEKGMVLNIEKGVPGSPRRMLSRGPAMYVLEVPMGWFGMKGLGPGSIIKFGE